MVGAYSASFSLTTTTATTTPKLLKPLLSPSISTSLKPRNLARRKNYLRPKILKTLTKPFPLDPVIPILTAPEIDDVVYEHQFDEVGEIVPAVEKPVEEMRVGVGTAGDYSGILGKFSPKSVLKIGFSLIAVFLLQTIVTVWKLGKIVDSDEKKKNLNVLDKGVNDMNKQEFLVNKNVGYADETELKDKINEIRAMAREARRIELKNAKFGGEEGGIVDGRDGFEREIGARLDKLEKKLSSSKGKSPSLDELEGVEDSKEVDKTVVMFKPNFKFNTNSSTMSSRNDVKGFSGSEYRSVNMKKKSDLVSGTMEGEKNGNEASSSNSKFLQNDKKSQKMQTDMRFGTVQGSTQRSSSVDVTKSRMQNITKESQENTMKSSKDAVLSRNGGLKQKVSENKQSVNTMRDNQDIKSDFWWLSLPYVLAVRMLRGSDQEKTGLFTLKVALAAQAEYTTSYTVAFQDRSDANNFCYLLETFFEDLDDFSAEIIPLQVKDLHADVKSGAMNVIVVKKGQLKLYAGQPFADVEKALQSLLVQNRNASRTRFT